jgi:hypothetical protein
LVRFEEADARAVGGKRVAEIGLFPATAGEE